MKQHGWKDSGRKAGVALVLTLSILVLLSVLFVGYFSSITTERLLSRHYAATTETRQLADSALSVVMAQITEATTRQPDLAWTSQPGLLRTFDANGLPVRAYKLYSSDRMVEEGRFDPRAKREYEVPENWRERSGEFIDLNAPLRHSGELYYPVLDPRAEGQVTEFMPDERDGVTMPVRWMYVLRDGRLIAGKYLVPGKVRVEGATTENPIIGRIAFWADDETCKVNINTASEGVFWDMPRTQSLQDRRFALSQPLGLEYQRYPGHPATVCLSAVFPRLVASSSPHYSKIYDMTPRISRGGSEEGTIDWAGGTIPTVTDNKDRLYASLDELLYTPERTPRDGLTAMDIERARFFLTVSNRCPDLNLWNRPRISLWPIHVEKNKRSERDILMAFSSVVPAAADGVFYFTRKNPASATEDFALGANRKLYEYLQKLTAQDVPGFGGKLETKYGARERDQILTEIFDFIRCVNLLDPGMTGRTYTGKMALTKPGRGQVVPLEIATSAGATRGFGRFPTISEAALDFFAVRANTSAKVDQIRVALLLATATPAQGYPALHRDYSVRVSTTTGFSLNGTYTFSFSGVNILPANTSSAAFPANDTALGGDEGFGHTLMGKSVGVTSTDRKLYPFVSPPFNVSGDEFSLGAGEIQIEILVANTVVQTLTLHFPEVAKLPMPIFPTGTHSGWSNYSNRMNDTDDVNPAFFQYDAVRSIHVRDGDVRLIAGKRHVPYKDANDNPYFAAGSDYASDMTFSFNLRDGKGRYYQGATGGKLVGDLVYANGVTPKVPADVNGAGGAGDWDNGVGALPDGAYIGKPDEGCSDFENGERPYFNSFTELIPAPAFFPQRQIASPVALGSLPTGVIRDQPWQTLLFCPNPASGTGHPGFRSAAGLPDFLWLDFFTLPVTEPYALSEPLSATGRVNLNHEIVPFTGITRATALAALFKSTQVLAIPTADAAIYKTGTPVPEKYHYPISVAETLKVLDRRFANGDVYRAPAEICSIHLVPENAPRNPTADSISAWWSEFTLTGDNGREMPYNHLYPLLTTQSNCFAVHFRTQALTKVAGTDPQVWEEGRDVIAGEYRGMSLLERGIDPKDTRLGSVDLFSESLTPYYRFRVISTMPFGF